MRVLIAGRPGSFFLAGRMFGRLQLIDHDGSEFSVPASDEVPHLNKRDMKVAKDRMALLKAPTPGHLLPGRDPVESDLPWQAFLRKNGVILAHTHPDSVHRVLRALEQATGLTYSPEHAGISRHGSHWKCAAFSIRWRATLGVPEGLPLKPRRISDAAAGTEEYIVSNTELVLDLLRLGLPFGYGHRERDENPV